MTNTTAYHTNELHPNKAIAKLRQIAHDRTKRILRNPSEPRKKRPMPITDLQFLARFVSETAFYIEELERMLDEELTDYWETREHALYILTEQMIDHVKLDSK